MLRLSSSSTKYSITSLAPEAIPQVAIATFPSPDAVPAGWVVAGRVTASDTPEVTVDGETWEGSTGWRHF